LLADFPEMGQNRFDASWPIIKKRHQ
jgi:hypothetical protein